MAKTHLSDAELEALFAEAQADAPVPSADLLSRILTGADAALGEQAATSQPSAANARPAPRPWQRLLDALGGWQTATGLVTAAAAGLGFGLFMPDTVSALAQGYYQDASYADVLADLNTITDPADLAPTFDQLMNEG